MSSGNKDPLIQILSRPNLVGKIFSHLNTSDFQECYVVNKTWEAALKRFRETCYMRFKPEDYEENKTFHDLLDDLPYYKALGLHKLTIEGWSREDNSVPSVFYDTLFKKKITLRKLIFRGRGTWDTCRCPKTNGTKTNGTLIDDVSEDEKTNLEVLIISESFAISSCALLDLISRSPKLKVLGFFGRMRKHDHVRAFSCKLIHSNLEQIYWPFPDKKQSLALNFIVKRNDKLTTIHSSMETVCDLLSGDLLPRLKYLSLNLNESWKCSKGDTKKAHVHLERIKFLALAKSVEALEVRTFGLDEVCDDPEDKETQSNVERIYENYKLSFWEQISKLTKLKYLAVYGAWELEGICCSLAKHCPGIEYFKTNCSPVAVIEALDNEDDCPILTMTDAIKNIRRLTSLRSIHFQCADKLANIENKTIAVLKELIDIIWIFDIKTRYSLEVEEFLNSLIKRGIQSGKQYNVDLHVQPKIENYAEILLDKPLKVIQNGSIKTYLISQAENAIKERFGPLKIGLASIDIWGLRLADMPRDRPTYEQNKKAWRFYEDLFHALSCGC